MDPSKKTKINNKKENQNQIKKENQTTRNRDVPLPTVLCQGLALPQRELRPRRGAKMADERPVAQRVLNATVRVVEHHGVESAVRARENPMGRLEVRRVDTMRAHGALPREPLADARKLAVLEVQRKLVVDRRRNDTHTRLRFRLLGRFPLLLLPLVHGRVVRG
jgi:hypothetical protein